MKSCIFFSTTVVLLIVTYVHCDQEEKASKTRNSITVIEFPIDQDSALTFASITFSPKLTAEGPKTFTLCFSLMIDAFKDGDFDAWQIKLSQIIYHFFANSK